MTTTPFPARPRRRRPSSGLTLVELLVAIVVLGFIMTLVSQAVFQVAQITRVADSTGRKLAGHWAEGWTLQDTLGNLASPSEVQGSVFEGTARQLRGYTTMPVAGEASGVQAFELSLRPDPLQPDGTEVWATSSDAGPGQAPAQRVARFPGRVEWVFIDRKQQMQMVWPPVSASPRGPDTEDLPTAVVARAANGAVVHWYPFTGETTRPAPPGKPFWEQ